MFKPVPYSGESVTYIRKAHILFDFGVNGYHFFWKHVTHIVNGYSMSKQAIPRFLTREQADLLLSIPNRRYKTGLRNYYLIRFLLGTGLRCSEALDVRVTDLDLAHCRLTVRNGKRRPGEKKPRRRTVALSQAMADALALYLAKRPWQSEYLFSTSDGLPLKSAYVRAMLARYGQKAGIPERVHPHLLRHTYATWCYDQNVPLSTIQTQLGHDRLTTTAIYAEASGYRQAQDVAKLSF
jgi:integrase